MSSIGSTPKYWRVGELTSTARLGDVVDPSGCASRHFSPFAFTEKKEEKEETSTHKWKGSVTSAGCTLRVP